MNVRRRLRESNESKRRERRRNARRQRERNGKNGRPKKKSNESEKPEKSVNRRLKQSKKNEKKMLLLLPLRRRLIVSTDGMSWDLFKPSNIYQLKVQSGLHSLEQRIIRQGSTTHNLQICFSHLIFKLLHL